MMVILYITFQIHQYQRVKPRFYVFNLTNYQQQHFQHFRLVGTMAVVSIIAIMVSFIYQSRAHQNDAYYPKAFECDYDEDINNAPIQNALKYKNHPYEHKLSYSGSELPSQPQLPLSDAEVDPIRISVYFDPDTISTTAGLSTDQIDYIKRITAGAVNFYQKWVQVIPVDGPLSYFGCNSWFGDQYDPDSSIKCVNYDLQCGQTTGTLSQYI